MMITLGRSPGLQAGLSPKFAPSHEITVAIANPLLVYRCGGSTGFINNLFPVSILRAERLRIPNAT